MSRWLLQFKAKAFLLQLEHLPRNLPEGTLPPESIDLLYSAPGRWGDAEPRASWWELFPGPPLPTSYAPLFRRIRAKWLSQHHSLDGRSMYVAESGEKGQKTAAEICAEFNVASPKNLRFRRSVASPRAPGLV